MEPGIQESGYDERSYDQKMQSILAQNAEEKFFTDWEETFDSFDQMNLHENLLRGIYAYGEVAQPPARDCCG